MGKRILIADDGQAVRDVLRALFETRSSFEICGEAATGLDAVEKAKALKPDIIVLDVAMPLMNGVETASVLAGIMPEVPIVLYTMYDEMLGLSLATAVGAKAVISKADGIGKLLECVQNLLEPPATAPKTAPSPPSSASPEKPPSIQN